MADPETATEEAFKPARACLRVVLQDVPEARTHHLQALVAKVVSSFLETCWAWPRQFEPAPPLGFILTDQRVRSMDLRELKHLARELQSKLFGIEGAGGVDLLVFEGDEVSIHRFANMAAEALAAFLSGASDGDLSGQLSRIAPTGVSPVDISPPAPPVDSPSEVVGHADDAAPRFEPCFRGSYFTPMSAFTSSVLMLKPFGATTTRGLLDRTEIVDGVAAEDYDRACIDALCEALDAAPPSGNLVIPLCFSSLVRPALRKSYAERLAGLSEAHRTRLGVIIYDTPRAPSFSALSQIVTLLRPWFANISLSVVDPDFDAESLAPGITMVSFVMQGADSMNRISGVRRFSTHLQAFKRKRIWPMVGGVRTRAEIEACIGLGVPFLMGPGLSDLVASPLNGRVAPLAALPLHR
jgi:hypothetical protein